MMLNRISVTLLSLLVAAPLWAVAPADSLSKNHLGMAVRTNLVWAAAAEPNIGLEFPVGDHWSIGANAGIKTWPRWMPWDKDSNNYTHWRNFAVVPEARYYISQVFQGAFAGADFIYTHFNVGDIELPMGLYPEIAQYREQGAYWGAGLFVGYAWWPWRHWRIELEAGVAGGLAAYDRYDCKNCGSKIDEVRRPAVVPKLGLNIAYNTVAKDKRRMGGHGYVIQKRDTLTLLTPPVAFVVNLQEVPGPESVGDRLAKEKPWVIPISKYRPLDYLTRPGKDSIQYVLFPVSDNKIQLDYARNGQVLKELQEAIETIRDEESTTEILVSIVGLASIEGPQKINDTLAIRRARAVADYLNKKTFISRKYFETIGKGEAWDWFKDQLEALPEGTEDINADQIEWLLNLVYNIKDADERERQLRTNTILYRKVVDHLLGDQRNAGYIRVYYNNKPDPATQKLNGPIYRLLNARQYHNAVREIQKDSAVMARVQENPEAANAYGVALYFTALDNADQKAEQEAVALLQKAAREGSQAAAENLKGIETYGPARKEYEAWKELMK